jgi:hypothetical protein
MLTTCILGQSDGRIARFEFIFLSKPTWLKRIKLSTTHSLFNISKKMIHQLVFSYDIHYNQYTTSGKILLLVSFKVYVPKLGL